jgi:hypothetical protein
VLGLIHTCLDATVQIDLTTFERVPIRGLHEAVNAALSPPGRRQHPGRIAEEAAEPPEAES